MNVFVDTSFFVGRIFSKDQWHDLAKSVDLTGLNLITSAHVVNETLTLCRKRGHFSVALTFLEGILNDDSVRIVHVSQQIQVAAWDGFRSWGAFGADGVDCTSFALMRAMRITQALSFDQHFRSAGFEVRPSIH